MVLPALTIAGKGVAALRKAGYVRLIPIGLKRIELPGDAPNLTDLLIQSRWCYW